MCAVGVGAKKLWQTERAAIPQSYLVWGAEGFGEGIRKEVLRMAKSTPKLEGKKTCKMVLSAFGFCRSISGLVVEYIVAIDVTRVRFPADAYCLEINGFAVSQPRCSKSAGPSTRKDRIQCFGSGM